MTIIKVIANDQLLTIAENPTIASGDQKSVQLQVETDSVWDKYALSATFFTDKDRSVYEMILVDNACIVPHEVLSSSCKLSIGIRGVRGDGIVKTSSLVKYKIIPGAKAGDSATIEPTPDTYQQILTAYEAVKKNATDAQEMATVASQDAEEAKNTATTAKKCSDTTKKLATPVKIGKASFDGSKNISVSAIMGGSSFRSSEASYVGMCAKIATINIDISWCDCCGLFIVNEIESASGCGILHFYFRTKKTTAIESVDLRWLDCTKGISLDSVFAVKVSDGIYDLYFKSFKNYIKPQFTLLNCSNEDRITLHSDKEYVSFDTLTPLATSYISNISSSLYGLTASIDELNYMKGVTSGVQGQLDGKAPSNHNHDGVYAPNQHSHAYLPTANVVNNLTTTGAGYALDARQGKALNDRINKIKILSGTLSLSNGGDWEKTSGSVTFSSAFSVPPIVQASTTEGDAVVHVTSISTTGCTISLYSAASRGSKTIRWTAMGY